MTRALHQLRLELAREPGKPEGDHRSGYGIVAHLDAEGRLDPKAARTIGKSCRVRRFPDDADDADDETGFRIGEEHFMRGEYVSLQARDPAMHAFRVAQVRTL